MQNASPNLVKTGGALHGVSHLDKQLTELKNAQVIFENPRTEALFDKIKKASRKDQSYGANEAKFEVLVFILESARAAFQEETKGAVDDLVKSRDNRRLEALAANKAGKVVKSDIEEMRNLLKSGNLTNCSTIDTYMRDFRQGKKGQKPPRRQFPYFLMLQHVSNEHMLCLIRAANNRGRKAPDRATSYFKRSSLVNFLSNGPAREASARRKDPKKKHSRSAQQLAQLAPLPQMRSAPALR
jgi:hypothetical protein